DIADGFEAAWQSGNPPRIGEYLAGAAGPRRLALLVELVKLDSAYRRWLGECRRPDDYLDEFPELNESDSFHPSATAEAEPSSAAGETVERPPPVKILPPAHAADTPNRAVDKTLPQQWASSTADAPPNRPGVRGYEIL